jgi:hypothetical protein
VINAAQFAQNLQDRMPQGWRIYVSFAPNNQRTGYEILCGEISLIIGTEGQCLPPDGWAVTYNNCAFYNEITITSPDGTSVMIDDGDVA